MKELDLTQLRTAITTAPADGPAAHVTKRFLEQVEREVLAGRAAQAQLHASKCINDVIQDLGRGAQG